MIQHGCTTKLTSNLQATVRLKRLVSLVSLIQSNLLDFVLASVCKLFTHYRCLSLAQNNYIRNVDGCDKTTMFDPMIEEISP